jgi:hypothetical protein
MATLSYGKDKYGGKTELEVLTVCSQVLMKK